MNISLPLNVILHLPQMFIWWYKWVQCLWFMEAFCFQVFVCHETFVCKLRQMYFWLAAQFYVNFMDMKHSTVYFFSLLTPYFSVPSAMVQETFPFLKYLYIFELLFANWGRCTFWVAANLLNFLLVSWTWSMQYFFSLYAACVCDFLDGMYMVCKST